MSLLAPLYALGLAAVSLPIVLHLLRRTPRGRQVFSSLMFLTPSPPRLTRRSRLDNLLLLLLRGLAITLIALAFARPFQREQAELDLTGLRGKRIAILVDTSASMRRPDLWPSAVKEVRDVLQALGPRDVAGLWAFADRVESVVPLPTTSKALLDPGASRAAIESQLPQLTPGWGATRLGAALSVVADALTTNEEEDRDAQLQIVLISDLQQGASIAALQQYEWPKNIALDVRTVAPKAPTNARASIVVDRTQTTTERRVRVVNAEDSERERFRLQWQTRSGQPVGEPEEVYVPPGQTRVVQLEQPSQADVVQLVLEGDDADFDNRLYVAPLLRRRVAVTYVGDDSGDDSRGLRYYLQRALVDTPRQQVVLEGRTSQESLKLDAKKTSLVVVGTALQDDQVEELKAYVRAGGGALVVLKNIEMGGGLASLLDQQGVQVQEVVEKEYAMLGEIDFRHPVFAAFADPRFSDFTKIRFWKRRKLVLAEDESIRIAARFDNGDPALVERRMDKGALFLLASGWQPDDSQLARSSKFVPLIFGLLDRDPKPRWEEGGAEVQDSIPLPEDADAQEAEVTLPSGDVQRIGRQAWRIGPLDSPGVYRVKMDDERFSLAVNLAASESRTAPREPGEFEQHGVVLGTRPTHQEEIERRRQLRDLELESRQKLWRFLIVAAMGLLIIETWLAGRLAREIGAESGATA